MTLMASLFNAPVNPVVASTLFIISYVRPVKFWEKNYKLVLQFMNYIYACELSKYRIYE